MLSKVCPDLTYAPMKALAHRRGNGTIKTANRQTGVGSIHCEEIDAAGVSCRVTTGQPQGNIIPYIGLI